MWKQLLWQRSGGYWLFWVSALYFAVGMLDIFVFQIGWSPVIQIVWLVLLSLPLWCNPVARFLNMKETNMFNLFNRKSAVEEIVDTIKARGPINPDQEVSTVEPAKNDGPPSEEAIYTIGTNQAGSVQLRIKLDFGSSTLTMNDAGTIDLIEQLAFQIRRRYKVEITSIEQEEVAE